MSVSIQCLPSSSRDATSLAAVLGVPLHEIAIHLFPDSEMRVTVGPASATTIIYTSLHQPNDKLIALMFAVEALRRGGAKRLVLVAPYLCYMRQDAAFHAGEAIGQKVIGQMLVRCFDRVVTVDAHLHRTSDLASVFPGIQSDNLSAMPTISDMLRQSGLDPATIVAGPDAESLPWVKDLAGGLGLSYTVATKTRRGDRSVAIELPDHACIAGRPVLIVDDIVSSGGTIIACAKALTAAGATAIDVVVTHALFPRTVYDEMISAGIRSVRSTHSVPHITNAIALDNLFAASLRSELAEASQ